jgi:hypothetical protein
MMPTIELMIKIVDTSIKQQEKRCCFFVASTQASEALSQALIELLEGCELVHGRPFVLLRIFGVLLFADFLRELVFYFLIA